MSERFADRVVVVAGGTGGLGRAVSLAFLRDGARVLVTFRKQAEFDVLKSATQGSASRLDGRQVDVTDEASVGVLLGDALQRHGRLDALVNAVGGYSGGVPLWEQEIKVLDEMLALNLRASYVLSRAAVRVMLKQRYGAIVNVAAQAALDHPAGAAAYAASKAAAVALLGSLAAELNGTGVRVNSILPSIIDTEANRRAMPKADFAKWPKPEDIARVVLFLCGDDAQAVHGAAIPVYGNNP